MPKFSVVVLNWNGKQYCLDCIESIKNQTFSDYELIIVDNYSTDGSREALVAAYPDEKFILCDQNHGFAKGMNIGIAECKGEIIVLLNNDVYIDNNFLLKIQEGLDKNPLIDGIQCKVYDWDSGQLTNIVQSKGCCFKHRVQCVCADAEAGALVFGTHGSFVILRKSAIDDVIEKSGYTYDEDFETGWEDIDLWFRLLLFGHKTIFLPEVKGWHIGSASADAQKKLINKSLAYQTRIFRNRYYVIQKNYTPTMMRKEWVFLLLAELCLLPYYLIKSPKSLRALWRAKKETRKNKARTKAKRARIMEHVAVDYPEIKQYYKGF